MKILCLDRPLPGAVDEARKTFTEFPLVKAGLIEFDIIPLGPFVNWEMLFASPAK